MMGSPFSQMDDKPYPSSSKCFCPLRRHNCQTVHSEPMAGASQKDTHGHNHPQGHMSRLNRFAPRTRYGPPSTSVHVFSYR
jgi:hypothetical protein